MKENRLNCIEIKNVTENSAELYIYGDILDDEYKNYFWEEPEGYVFPGNVKAQLDTVKGKDLKIYINSCGGFVFAGVAIGNMIKRHEGKTIGIVDGLAASIATQILFSCDEVQIPKNAFIMIHKPSCSVSGDADKMLKAIKTLDTIQEGIEALYREYAKEGITAEKLHEMTNNETWLNGEQAAQYFNVKVLEPLDAVACADSELIKKFSNMPHGISFSQQVTPSTQNETQKENKIKNKKIEIALAIERSKIL